MNFLKYKRDKGRRDKGKEGGNKREKEVGKNGGREGKKGERGRRTKYVIQSNENFICFFGNAILPAEERVTLQLS